MTASDVVTRGLGKGRLALGIFFAGAGIIFICLAFFEGYTLEVSGILLPQWIFYAVAVIAILFGGFGIKTSLAALLCVKCRSELKYAEAFFPVDREVEVSAAFNGLSAEKLAGVPMFTGASPALAGRGSFLRLSLDYCPKCRLGGVFSLRKFEPHAAAAAVLPPQIVTWETAAAFLPYMKEAVRRDKIEVG